MQTVRSSGHAAGNTHFGNALCKQHQVSIYGASSYLDVCNKSSAHTNGSLAAVPRPRAPDNRSLQHPSSSLVSTVETPSLRCSLEWVHNGNRSPNVSSDAAARSCCSFLQLLTSIRSVQHQHNPTPWANPPKSMHLGCPVNTQPRPEPKARLSGVL